MFLDRVKLKLSAGQGGNGVVAWRREAFIPKGGPLGGNGGRGASLFIEGDETLFSLEKYRNQTQIAAADGKPGEANQRSGKGGTDLILKVPCGTIVKDAVSGAVIVEITEHKQRHLICSGGKGGLGNAFFKSATRQAPNFATPGKPGGEVEVEFELKLIADIGLVGMPNAGKSTLLSRIAQSPFKIGSYPFTTLYPNIGSIPFEDYTRILVADVPGIIKDAHKNKGLGISFLKHIERCRALVFVVDGSGEEGRDPLDDVDTLRAELECYSEELCQKPILIAFNKSDKESAEQYLAPFRKRFPESQLCVISGETGHGVPQLLEHMRALTR